MNDFEKILQSIRLNPDRRGPELVSRAFAMLGHERCASSLRSVLVQPTWKEIRHFVEPLRSPAEDQEFSALCLRRLFLLLDEKCRAERHIASMVPLADRKKAALFSNYTEERFRHLLLKLIRHACTSGPKKQELETYLHTRKGLLRAVKELHRLEANAYGEDRKKICEKRMHLLNAINAAMEINLSKFSTEPLFCGFRHCDVCPRLVRPPESGVCRCELHDYQSGIGTAYKQALEVTKRTTPKHHNSLSEYLQERLYRKLRRVLPDSYPEGISPEDWWRLLDEDPELLAARGAPVCYDLAALWKALPRTRKYVESRGGNLLEPASVLAALNPPEPNEPQAWKERRALLNAILSRNFAPFRFELARTEAWLIIHDKLFGNKKHGGARPGSGGTRPGAGRPRKN